MPTCSPPALRQTFAGSARSRLNSSQSAAPHASGSGGEFELTKCLPPQRTCSAGWSSTPSAGAAAGATAPGARTAATSAPNAASAQSCRFAPVTPAQLSPAGRRARRLEELVFAREDLGDRVVGEDPPDRVGER